jgi:Skp family chaperone for outer membrane proteins
MKLRFNAVAAAVLAASLAGSYAYAGDPPSPAKKKRVAKAPPKPTVEEQIQSLRQEFQGQIDGLKSDLAAKDAQLRQAQQSATDAQAAAAKAEADATAQQQATTDNTAAVSTLQGTVSDLKQNAVSLATTVSDDNAAIKKQIATPDAIHFKGATLSFTGSFLAAETTWRSAAIGADVNTPFTAVPLQAADAAQQSEFYGSGRQSRLAFKATGKVKNATLTGYYEMDWLGSGTTSNNNQSNSYLARQRQLWADAKFTNGWDVSGGQGWSLATETTQGLTRGSEILPGTIDAQYTAGFVWARQYSFRVSKDFSKKFFVGISAENAETLNPAGASLPLNIDIGGPGANGGLYNVTANYSFNETPDFIAKVAFQPGWGHWEVFGIERNFRDRIYPNEVCSNATVGTTTTGVNSGITVTSCTGNTTGAYNDSIPGAGIGGGFRAPVVGKIVNVGLKGLWGKGMGRYGSSTIADITLRPDGEIDPLKAFSALGTLEINPSPRFQLYFNYGGDYVYRDFFGAKGYGSPSTSMTGCNTEPAPGGTNNTYGGNGTGFDPGTPGSCGNQNKDVQELSVGDWYYIYRGPMGGLRFGLQYSRIERDLWSGVGGPLNPSGKAEGLDNMFFTSFRYYLP